MPFVFRLMNSEGKGWRSVPYMINDPVIRSRLRDGTERWQHPDCGDNPLARSPQCWTPGHPDADKYWYGFATLRHACIWFAESELAELAIQGFHLFVADVAEEAILHGERQVAFLKDAAPLASWSRVDVTTPAFKAVAADAAREFKLFAECDSESSGAADLACSPLRASSEDDSDTEPYEETDSDEDKSG